MASSTAPAVKRDILARLQAATPLAGVQVTYGWPGRNPEREWLMLGDISYDTEGFTALGTKSRDEYYSVSCVVNVQSVGGTSQDAMERAYVIFAAVENVLRAAVTLNGLCMSAEVIPRRAGAFPVADGHESQLEADIKVRARI